jgi:hypothetical protein
LESAVIKSMQCTVLSNDGLLIEAIKNVFQIYEFDLTLVTLQISGTHEFEIPLSEWLKELVSIVKSGNLGIFDRKLMFSGYDFLVNIEADSITLSVRDIRDYTQVNTIHLSRSELLYVIDFMREFLISSYEKYGGSRHNLEDMSSYTLP